MTPLAMPSFAARRDETFVEQSVLYRPVVYTEDAVLKPTDMTTSVECSYDTLCYMTAQQGAIEYGSPAIRSKYRSYFSRGIAYSIAPL